MGKVSMDSGGYLVLVGYVTKRTRVISSSERRIVLLKLWKRTIYRLVVCTNSAQSCAWSRQSREICNHSTQETDQRSR